MNAISRREFFKKTAADAAIAGFLAAAAGTRLSANPLGLPIGSQTYPHRERIIKNDFAGLLKDMKAAGIEVIELCNPSYKEFSSLADGKQTRKILDDNGIKCLSAHFTMPSLRQEQGKQIEWAQAVGMTMMSTASLGGRVTNGMTTLEEVKRACDEYNKIGAITKAGGHADRRRSDHVLQQPPRPICLDASAGRGRHARNAGVDQARADLTFALQAGCSVVVAMGDLQGDRAA